MAGTPNSAADPAGSNRASTRTHLPDLQFDRRCVEQTLAGDIKGYEALFTHHRDRLYHIAYKMLGNQEEALDMVQDAFVRAYERLDTLQGDVGFYPWIRRIMVNLTIDAKRKASRQIDVDFNEMPVAQDPAYFDRTRRPVSESPLAAAEYKEFSGALWAALERLSPVHRAVFILHAVEDLSYREIAEELNIRIGTVMSRLHYARRRLQELLAPHLPQQSLGRA